MYTVDFNGDGKTDIFLANGKTWRVSWGGKTKWERLGTSSYKKDQLGFEDFNGDGIDDAYDIHNGGTYITPVNTDGVDNPDYLDLDSDNDLDILIAKGDEGASLSHSLLLDALVLLFVSF